MDQITKDIMALSQIKNAAKLLEGEFHIQVVHSSTGVKQKRIVITYEDRDLFGQCGKAPE
jgi:hypothetical protein